jgi:hypothetical protein
VISLVTKTELLTALATQVYTVGTPTSVTDTVVEAAGFAKYNVEFYDDVGNNIIRRSNANFLVANEGTQDEEAFWEGGTPVVVTNFVDTVRASPAFTSKHATIEEEDTDWARIYGYDDNGDGTMTKKWWIVEDDGAGGLNIYTLTNPGD